MPVGKIAWMAVMLLVCGLPVRGQQGSVSGKPEMVILDTDIGDDIDDAFALGLALSDQRLQVLGVTTTFGDTTMRAALTERFLNEIGHGEVPVYAGRQTPMPGGHLTQERYAQRYAASHSKAYPPALPFLRDTIEAHPGEITLLGIGPEFNIGDLIRQYPATFHKLKRVVIMGGSVYAGYGDLGYRPPHGRDPEWNIKVDPASAKLLFGSGIPLYVMPLDSTQSKIDEVKREILFSEGSPMTDALTLLYHEWYGHTHGTPTAYDVVAVAYAMDPAVCPATPLRLEVDDKGDTVPVSGAPNVQVCLHVSEDRFFPLLMQRLLAPQRVAP